MRVDAVELCVVVHERVLVDEVFSDDVEHAVRSISQHVVFGCSHVFDARVA